MSTKGTKAVKDRKDGTHDGKAIEAGDGARILESFPLGERGDIGVISISEYKGKKGLDLRRYYLDEQSESFKPTSKGIRIPAERVENFLDHLVGLRGEILGGMKS